MKAFVLLKVTEEYQEEVYGKLLMTEGAITAYMLFGEWDLIIKLDADDAEHLSRIVFDYLKKLPGVIETTTYVIAK